MKKTLGTFLAMTLLVAACGTDPDLSAPAGIDGSWQLVAGTNAGMAVSPIDSHPVTLTIDGASVGGTAACNSYGGEWTINGSRVSIGNLAQTEMACDPISTMDLERDFLNALTAVTTAGVDDAELVLSGPDLELRFTALTPPPTAELLGTVWHLETLIEGDAASSVLADPTLEFFSDGSFIATTGCRNITGNYVESGPEIATTQMAAQGDCTPDFDRQDGQIITVLEGGYRVAIDGQQLTLTIAGDEGLVYRAALTN